MSCPDCKDGFYYPFTGPRETCRTCKGCQFEGCYKPISQISALAAIQAQGYTKAKSSFYQWVYGESADFSLKDESSSLKEIGHVRCPVAEMISESIHPASVHPDPQDADKVRQEEKDHYYTGQAASMAETQAEKDAIWAKAKISEPTDWSQWFPKKYHRDGILIELFENHPTRLIDFHADSIEGAIIGRMFRTLAMGSIKDFFKDRKTVCLHEIAEFLNLTHGKRLKYLSRQTLKENDSKEL